MKVNLPLAFPIIIRFIIYRDSLCIFLFSRQGCTKKVFNFRLPLDFWLNPHFQINYVVQFLKFIEQDLGIKILLNGQMVPSDLSPVIDSYEIIVRQDKGKVFDLLGFFDKVVERNFDGFSKKIETLESEKFLYFDYDVDYIGFFVNCNKRRVGGYWNLSYWFYKKLGLTTFLEQSVFDLDVSLSQKILSEIIFKMDVVLEDQGVSISNISKIYLGGITGEYFDVRNTRLGIGSDLDIIEDSHFELILNGENV